MQPDDLTPGVECLDGHKWYMQSGEIQLVVSTELGPVDAAIKLVLRAMETDRLAELGRGIYGSQIGFGDDSIIFARPTRKFAARTCGVPDFLFDLEGDR